MRKYLMLTGIAALMSASVSAQSMSDAEWDKVRSFLDSNPKILNQVTAIIDRMPAPNQIELDAKFISENKGMIFDNPLSPRMGVGQGTVTIVKFNDFRCGYCRRLSGTFDELLESNQEVEIVVREFPILGPQSETAARFALAVWSLSGREGYEKAHDMMFATQDAIDNAFVEKSSLSLFLDPKNVLLKMQSPDITAHIEETKQLATSLKINGTPAMIIGGTVARGALPLDILEAAVSEQKTVAKD